MPLPVTLLQIQQGKIKMGYLPLNLILAWTLLLSIAACKSTRSEHDKMVEFGENYTEAWNSRKPEKMASFYAENGTLVVNNGRPAKGRQQLAETARSYMEAFPDLQLRMDSMVDGPGTYKYHWTFKGTNTGPGGTGNKVYFNGFEEWTMNKERLIQKSIGSYNAEEYNRQVNGN
jgi:nuclear transport factor 2 (NTF2) superfamily protein